MRAAYKRQAQQARRLALLLCILLISLSTNHHCPDCLLEIETTARILQAQAASTPATPRADGRRVRTEALPLIGASEYHAAGILGAGVKVAVIDEHFAGLAERIAEGELPPTLITRRFSAAGESAGMLAEGGTAHGIACAEIIHDIAPQAQLYLIQVDNLVNRLEAVLDYLHAEGVRVVSISMSTLSPSRGDGTGRVADSPAPLYALLDAARADGMLLIKSVGNYAQQHYRGAFLDADGSGWHEFGRSRMGIADQRLPVRLQQGKPVNLTLTWDDWGEDPLRPATGFTYELYLFDARGAEMARSAAQREGSPPVQSLTFTPRFDGLYEIGVRRGGTFTQSHTLDIFAVGEGAALTAAITPEHSLGVPADARSVLAVGAVNVSSGRPVPTSSRGPTTDGRIKPDLSSYSFVSVASPEYGPYGFGGTSAAAPHVAGMAALLLSAPGQRDLPVAALEAQLLAAARDRGAPGPDALWGAGVAQLPPLDVIVRDIAAPIPHRDPARRFIKVSVERSDGSPLLGLSAADFEVAVGSATTPVLTTRSAGSAYLLEISPPPLPPGVYAVEVTTHGRSARAEALLTLPEAPPPPAAPLLEVIVASAAPRIGDPLRLLASVSGRRPQDPMLPLRIGALVTRPDGEVDTLTFHDDGLHDEGVAGDGVYGGWYPRTTLAGSYHLEIMTVSGRELLTAAPPESRLELVINVQPDFSDADGDGLPDAWERAMGLRVGVNDAHQDPDGDGLSNLEEFLHGADPLNWDTDGDGLSDGAEIFGYFRTSPFNADTDLGGVDDGSELRRGTHPLNPADDFRDGAPFFLPLQLRPFTPRPRPRNHAVAGDFVWLATDGGVIRWDRADRTYVAFTQTDGLLHDTVYAVLHDAEGWLWIGTQGGVSRFDGARWQNFDADDGLPHPIVRALTQAPDGSIWAATALGAARFDGARWQAAPPPPVVELYAITADSVGRVWIGGQNGAAFLENGRWHPLEALADTWITALAADAGGRIWLGTWGAGLAMLDTAAPGDITWITHRDGLGDNFVAALLQDAAGVLWVRTLAGLSAFDGTGWTLFTADAVIQRQARYQAPIGEAVHRWFGSRPLAELPPELYMMMTAEQRPWFGVARRAEAAAGTWIHYQTPLRERAAALALDARGRVWVATGSSLSVFDGARWAMHAPFEGLPERRIVALAADVGGAVWAGTDGAGVLKADGRTWSRLDARDGLVSSFIYAVAVEPNGDVWSGSGGGLNGVSRLRPSSGAWLTVTRADVLGGDSIRAIALDPQGAVWFGSERSVARFEGGIWAPPIPTPAPVNATAVDASGQLWIGTSQGLAYLEAGRWVAIANPDAAAPLVVRDIAIAPNGALWCATPIGAWIFDPGEGSWRALTAADGLLSDDVWQIVQDEAGQLWFATSKGLSLWVPDPGD